VVGPLSTELVLAALATCKHYLAELRLRLQNGLQPELRGRAADGEASCGLCGRRVGQLPWRWLAGSEEAGDEHRGWCGEFGRQGMQGIRR